MKVVSLGKVSLLEKCVQYLLFVFFFFVPCVGVLNVLHGFAKFVIFLLAVIYNNFHIHIHSHSFIQFNLSYSITYV